MDLESTVAGAAEYSYIYPTLSLRSEKSSTCDSNLPTSSSSDLLHCFTDDVHVNIHVSIAENLDNSRSIRYKIAVSLGKFKWVIYARLIEIVQLRWTLQFSNLASPTIERENYFDTVSGVQLLNLMMKEEIYRYTKTVTDVVEGHLNFITSIKAYRKHPSVLAFFEISKFSFLPELGEKGRESFVEKRSASCFMKNASWTTRWFILKDNFLFYLDSDKKKIQGVFLFDRNTVTVRNGDRLTLKNSSHRIFLKFPNEHHCASWEITITDHVQNIQEEFNDPVTNVGSCFSPIRLAPTHWFVDGCDYFSSVADALDAARHEIFISAWSLAPHIYLKRLPCIEDRWMLKSILQRKANEGIKIYILLYDAPDGFVKLGDQFAKTTLESLSKNIRVLRHRGKVVGKTILWSHHEKLIVIDQNVAFVSGIDLAFGRWDCPEHPLTDTGNSSTANQLLNNGEQTDYVQALNGKMWPGADYSNDFKSSGINFSEPFQDHIDRNVVPRTPWHDIACVTYEDAARDVARHFIQMWNYVKAKERRKQDKIRFLIPKTYLVDHSQMQIHPYAVITFAQVLRSASTWSCGISETEKSIAEAYGKAIDEAEHYIYIENQFFISQTGPDKMKNLITYCLRERILRAIDDGTKFRVYIVLPLVPLFEGDFTKANKSQQIQAFAHYQYHSISRGRNSLLGSLQSYLTAEEVDEYVSFCSLRNHDELNGELVTEVLYVHSKMMIVDDKIAIIGSANINDRSLVGDRDSEVCLWIEDTETIDSVMDGRPYRAGKFASSLRQRVFAEHLGLLQNFNESFEMLQDIVCDRFYHGLWKETARNNTEVYNKVLRTLPADEVRRFSQVRDYETSQSEISDKRTELQKVKGFLVQFPMEYLAEEDLTQDRLGILPEEFYT